MTDDRGQMTDDRGRMTDDREQITEVGGQMTVIDEKNVGFSIPSFCSLISDF